MEKILVIAAHPDDEVLGCGGTIKRLIDEGNEAYCLILSDGTLSRYTEVSAAAKKEMEFRMQESLHASQIIGYKETLFCQFADNSFDKENLLHIVKTIEQYIALLKPSILFTHHYGDLNIDHQITFQAVQTATRPMEQCSVKEIYCFETFSSTEWNFLINNKFAPNCFINIEATLKDKLAAMKCYQSEIKKYPHPRSLEALEVCSKRWGTVVGCAAAEAFELIRKVVL